MLAEKVKKFISANSLIAEGQSVLVAFSGGADSMCLLHILKSLSYNVSAAHLNHMLRGAEAESDEKVAENFCKKYDIPFYKFSADIAHIAEESGISEETAGRNERYKFFDRITTDNSIDLIATAHNQNDNAETIIMHIIRGCGTAGLSGIPVKRENIIRPLLSCSRSEIEEYCLEHKLPFVTDSTNLTTVYTRNKIRHQLMPLLNDFNSNILSSFSSLSELMTADKEYFEEIIEKLVGNSVSLPLSELSYLSNSVIYRMLSRLAQNAGLSPEFRHIKLVADMIKSGVCGKRIDVPGGSFEISCGVLSAVKTLPQHYSYTITPECEIELEKYSLLASNITTSPINFTLSCDSEVVVRSRLPGDKIRVRGMTKKISDLFIDKKIPASERNKIPILTVDGEIIYVLGYEKSDIFPNISKSDKTFVLNITNKEYNNE